MDIREKLIQATKNENILKKQMHIAAIISSELKRRGTNIVMVGGSPHDAPCLLTDKEFCQFFYFKSKELANFFR